MKVAVNLDPVRVWYVDKNKVLVPAEFTIGGLVKGWTYYGPTFGTFDEAIRFINEHGTEGVDYRLLPYRGKIS